MWEDWVTTDVAADELGVTRWAVLKALRDKRLTGKKVGRDYFIERQELDRFKRERRHRGRPRKEPPAVSDYRYPLAGDVATFKRIAEH